MSVLRSALCLIVCFLVCSSEAQVNITAVIGEDIILPCKDPNNKPITAVIGEEVTLTCKDPNNNEPIIVVEWTRPGLEPDHVLFYRDGRLISDNQHPSYQNRVDLEDREMKNGDVSMVLMNVTKNDNGTYECRVHQREPNRSKRATLDNDPIKIINLAVDPPGNKNGGDKAGGHGVGIGLGVGVFLLTAVSAPVAFVINRRHNKKKPNLPVPPDEPAADQML